MMLSKTLIRTDKNGTEYYEGTERCDKCHGTGHVDYYNYYCGGLCFDCNGVGTIRREWKVMTKEHEEELERKRILRMEREIARKKASFSVEGALEALGLTEGLVLAFFGDTYAVKDALKEAGYIFRGGFWMTSDKNPEIQNFASHNVSVKWDEVFKVSEDATELVVLDRDVVKANVDSHVQGPTAPKRESEFVGAEGDKVEVSVRIKYVGSFDTQFGTTHVYNMADDNGNVYVWKTSSYPFGKDERVTLKATIKGHDVYNGVKQTILTRCKAV